MNNFKAQLQDISHYHQEFKNLIKKKLGIVLRYHDHELDKIVFDACKRFNCTPIEYLMRISASNDDSPIVEDLINEITIGETYFFRDKNQMQLLQNEILPEIIKKKREEGNLTLRIWSAGCSSGEEIYTIAMMLNELLSDIAAWTINLLGTDINTKVLHKAIDGKYTEWSMRSTTPYHKKKYFTQKNKDFFIIPKLKNAVTFSYLNLNYDLYPSIINGTNAQDLILCRNVLIYFDTDTANELMTKLSKCLSSDGYLMLGASDPIILDNTGLTFRHQKIALFSISEEEKTQETPAVILPRPVAQKKAIKKPEYLSKQEQSEIKMPIKKDVNLATINQFMQDSRWEEALKILNQFDLHDKKNLHLLNLKATVLSNMGQLVKADSCCQESLSIDPMNKLTYFTRALILSELNQIDASEKALRKTLYIDNQFVMGHFQLGMLLLRKNQTALALKSLMNAYSISSAQKAKDEVPGTPGLTFGHLAEILKHEIDIYSGAFS